MRNIMLKEMKLSASPLPFFFILFGLMFLLPGYPVLCGAFFVGLGIFQGFQYAREANDIAFSVLLPISKKDIVKGKYMFVGFIEMCSLVLMTAAVLMRMTAFVDSEVYRSNAMMNANFFALAGALVVFGVFNAIFLGGFFRTAYNIGKPFITFIIAGFLVIGLFETVHHIHGFEIVNAFGFENIAVQTVLLLAGAAVYAIMTLLSYRSSCRNFERIDL